MTEIYLLFSGDIPYLMFNVAIKISILECPRLSREALVSTVFISYFDCYIFYSTLKDSPYLSLSAFIIS
ncbi:unnamed protein product [Brugia timori]|uniref:Uncharacterized protein n=1 Tax=Brugia timori TaxID=42155 RepID=A0A3P7VIQ5_9BILA|nr:unnamed protein product [Brugia timori]